MEQKTLVYKDNTYRIRKMNAIEALALRSASDMKTVAGAKVTECLKRGNFSEVKVNLYDDENDLCGEMEFDGKEIASDIRVGMVFSV